MKLSHLSLLFTTFAGTNGLLCQCTGSFSGKTGKTAAACSTLEDTRMQSSGGSLYCVVPDKQTMKQACKQVGMKGDPNCIPGGDSKKDGKKEPKEDGPSRPPPPSDSYGGGYSQPPPPSNPYSGGYGGYPVYPTYPPPKDRNYGSAAEDDYHDPRGTWANSRVDWLFAPPRGPHNGYHKRSLGERGVPVTRRRKSSKRVVRRQRKEVLGEHHAS
ncbi:hypothetical protein LZ30DRAFT_775811 [Colletotrichum cereale]|nr:hypothetical protein LZ30DRAFT_775811 [Colletotrichum cereale]